MGSSTTTKTEIPDPTPEERELLAKAGALADANLNQMGIYTTKTETNFEQSDDYKAFQNRKTAKQSIVDNLNTQLTTLPQGPKREQAYIELQKHQRELDDILKKEETARKDFKPSYDYKIYEAPTQEVKSVIDQFGVESQQYKDSIAKYREQVGKKEKDTAELEQMAIAQTRDFLSGNFGLNEGEQKMFDELLGPMKSAALNAIDYVTNQAKENNKSVSATINEFENRIKETGMNLETGLLALEDRVKQTGLDMGKALDEELNLTRELTKMGMEDFTNSERMRLSNQAAALGRSSTDPKFIQELVSNVNREIQRTELQTGVYGAQQKMGIAERTGSGLESAQNMRMGITERTGAGLEQGAQLRMGLAEKTGDVLQGIAGQRGQLELGLADTAAQLRQQLAYGMTPSQVGLGMNVGQYQNALMQQRIANTQAAMQAPISLYDTMARERFAEPTTTQKTSGGIGDILGGVIGAGVGAAGAYSGISSAGALNKLAG